DLRAQPDRRRTPPARTGRPAEQQPPTPNASSRTPRSPSASPTAPPQAAHTPRPTQTPAPRTKSARQEGCDAPRPTSAERETPAPNQPQKPERSAPAHGDPAAAAPPDRAARSRDQADLRRAPHWPKATPRPHAQPPSAAHSDSG